MTEQTGQDESTTEELLRAAAAGDGAAWPVLMRRYRPVVRARMRPYDLQEADRLDVEQTVWMRLAEHLGRLHTPAHLGGWLSTTVAREALRVRRGYGRATLGDEYLKTVPVRSESGPEERAVAADVARRLWRAVDELPPTRRELVRALFAENVPSYAEISRRTGTPVGAIGPTRGRVMRELRVRLTDLDAS